MEQGQQPEAPAGLNGLAWLLATCPDPGVRDGKRAVELAKEACKSALGKKGNELDTLAAAYAETGQFEEAVRQQEMALDDPEFTKLAADGARKRLELYRQGKPYHAH